jgi:broad specificity phosphatase PhoE
MSNPFNIILVRHGISCGNLMKETSMIPFLHKMYSDPELTIEGRKHAFEFGKDFRQSLENDNLIPVVGASVLIRAQQTADLLFNPKKILIVPYVAEIGSSFDNIPRDKYKQKEIFKKICMPETADKRDYNFYKDYKDGPRSNIASFKKWLRLEFDNLVNEPNKVLVIVCHGIYIRHLIENIGFKKELRETRNCEAHKFFYDKDKNKLNYKGEYKYTFLKKINTKENCKVDFCRKNTCKKNSKIKSCDDVHTYLSESIKNKNNLNKTRKQSRKY